MRVLICGGGVIGVAIAWYLSLHSVWGMLNASATGEAMAELIAEGAARSVDLAPFAPGRLRRLDPSRLRTG
jgi:glycine/D-amino acid oxidase-like deaminating enzyme